MWRDKFFFSSQKMIKIKKSQTKLKKHLQYNKYDFLFGKKKKCMGLELEIEVAVVRQWPSLTSKVASNIFDDALIIK